MNDIMNDVNLHIKYSDYFGEPMIMAMEYLGLSYMKYDKDQWTYEQKLHYAAMYYYYKTNVTLQEAIEKVDLEPTEEIKLEIAKKIKSFFGNDAFNHFVIKGHTSIINPSTRK